MSVWPAGSPDDLGIIRCTDATVPWMGVPPAVGDIALRAREPEDVISSMLDGPQRWPVALQRRLLHAASGVPAVLAPVGAGVAALDLGTGWFGLAPALATLGADVTRADWVYSRLRFARLMHPVPGCVDVLLDLEAVATSARFDVVFLDLDAVPARAQRALLSTAAGLLRTDGTIVAGVTEHKARLVKAGSFAAALRTSSVRAVARAAGLEVRDTYCALPDRVAPMVLAPRARLAEQVRTHRRYRGARAVAVRLVLAVGAASVLATDRYVVLGRAGVTGGRGVAAEAAQDGRPALVLPLSDARAGVLGSRGFTKIALSADQQRALVAEAENTRRARRTELAAHVVEPRAVGRAGEAVSVTYPVVHGRSVDTETMAATIDAVLSRIDRSRTARLDRTPLWQRLTSDRGQRDIASLDVQRLWTWLEDRCSHYRVPVGPNHGDLHPDNVLVPTGSGPAVLVDWNRFEVDNPLLLDPLYAAIHVEQSTPGRSFAESLRRAGSDALSGPLAVRARQLRGELSALEAVTLVLLDRVASYSRPRRRFKPWTLSPFEEAVATLELEALGRPPDLAR